MLTATINWGSSVSTTEWCTGRQPRFSGPEDVDKLINIIGPDSPDVSPLFTSELARSDVRADG